MNPGDTLKLDIVKLTVGYRVFVYGHRPEIHECANERQLTRVLGALVRQS